MATSSLQTALNSREAKRISDERWIVRYTQVHVCVYVSHLLYAYMYNLILQRLITFQISFKSTSHTWRCIDIDTRCIHLAQRMQCNVVIFMFCLYHYGIVGLWDLWIIYNLQGCVTNIIIARCQWSSPEWYGLNQLVPNNNKVQQIKNKPLNLLISLLWT